MFEEKKIVNNKNDLFVESESELHYVKCSPDSDEYLKVWIKQPTWLQVEKAMNTVLKLDAKSQNVDLDLNAMYRYMVENFIDRTEPSLATVDLLRLKPYVGNQLKEILPNPFGGELGGDEGKLE
jgi:hypothetical protein|tara:strand:+ start:54 stop:425 length:372 start_codon:yes stop_codon:yes gene_type:complete